MDKSAIVLARDRGLPLHVFDLEQGDAIGAICSGENNGTYISPSTTLETMAPQSASIRDRTPRRKPPC